MISKFKKFDLFGSKVEFNFNGNRRSASLCGVSVSFLCIAIILVSIYIAGNDIVLKQNPKVVTSSIFSQDPEKMIISPDTFPLAFGLQHENTTHYLDETIYKPKIIHIKSSKIFQADGSSIEERNITNIQVERCSPTHFGELSSKFNSLFLNQLYCINYTNLEKLHIQGLFESPMYETITISIEKCNNETSEQKCVNSEKIDELLSGGWFAIYYPNLRMDLKNFSNPAVRSRDSYFTSVSSKHKMAAQMWLQHVELLTDTGVIFETLNTERFIQMDHVREFPVYKENLTEIFSLDIRVEQIKNDYKRSYVKVQDIFASVDGTATILMLITILLIKPYATLKFYEGLVNEAFDIKLDESREDINSHYKGEKYQQKGHKNRPVSESGVSGTDQNTNIKQDSEQNPPPPRIQFTKDEVRHANVSNKSELYEFSPIFRKQNTNLSRFSRLSTIKAPDTDGGDSNRHKDIEVLPKFAFTEENIAFPNNNTNDIRFRNFEEYINKNGEAQNGDFNRKNKAPKIQAEKPVKLNLKILDDNEDDLDTFSMSFKIREKNKEEEEIKTSAQMQTEDEQGVQTERRQLFNDRSLEMQDFKQSEKLKMFGESIPPEPDNPEERKEYKEDEVLEIDPHSVLPMSTKPVNINISFIEFLMSYIWMPKGLKRKMKILEKGISRMEKKLDIFNVLRSLREIEKLKILLFESEQFVLFDNLPKPTLLLNNPKKINMSFSHSLLKKATITEFNNNHGAINGALMNSYRKLKRGSEASASIIDRKLIDIYGEILNKKAQEQIER